MHEKYNDVNIINIDRFMCTNKNKILREKIVWNMRDAQAFVEIKSVSSIITFYKSYRLPCISKHLSVKESHE